MKRVVILFILFNGLMIAACTNSSSKQEEELLQEDTAVQEEPAASIQDTTQKNNTAPSFELTVAEEQDDPEFHKKANSLAWSQVGITDPLAFKKFLKKLKYWVANDERDSIAKLIAYPLTHPAIRDQIDFLNQYENYFNEKVKSAVAKQQLDKVVKTHQGAMLDGGALWFKQTETGFKITFINH